MEQNIRYIDKLLKGKKVLVPDICLKVVGGDTAFAKKLLCSMYEILPSHVNEFKETKKQDKQSFADAVHKLLGGVSHCGLERLKVLSRELEGILYKKEYDENLVDMLYEKILSEIEKAQEEIKKNWIDDN